MNDPYLPPASEVANPITSSEILPKVSTWLVFLFTIITLHFYMYYWLINRSVTLNAITKTRKISDFYIYFVPVFSIAAFIVPILDQTLELGLGTLRWESSVTLLSNILMILWAFSIRSSLKEIALLSDPSKFRIGGVLTFLLTLFYLNYKINELHEINNSSTAINEIAN